MRHHRPFAVASIAAVLLTTAASFAQERGTIVVDRIDPYSFQPENDAVAVDAETVDIARIFEDLDPVAREWYQHVMTLSNPWFEGRAPGSDGIERAADYIEFWFRRHGLEPAFPATEVDDAASDDWTSYRQPFEMGGGRPRIMKAEASIDGRGLDAGRDFTVLGNSGTAEVAAPLAFAGYAIEDGPDGWSSFDDDDTSLDGRIAIVFRYEPLDDEGRSRFSSRRFSEHASIPEKMTAVADRGAAGIVLVNPPGALFGKDGLEDSPSGRFGAGLDIPVVQVTPEIAERMIAASGGDGDLMTWRRKADEGGHGIVPIGDDVAVALATEVNPGVNRTANVGGVLAGRGDLADEWIVIGGHYDHVGYGDFGAMPSNRGRLHPGADDDASGTSGVLMLAKLLAEAYENADDDADLRSVLFMTFTAEESGLNGSRHYVEHPTLPAGSINAMLNLDMIGRLRSDTLAVGGMDSAWDMLERITPDLEASGLAIVADPNGRGPSDHASFFGAGIPVLFFFTGTHDVYHRPGDHGWTVNPRGAAKVIDLVEAIAMRFATDPDKLKFGKKPEEAAAPARPAGPDPNDRGYAPVRLGIRPGMGGGDSFGVKVEGVSPGTSAAEGGILEGDVIVAWGGEDLVDVMDMVTRLRNHKPGDVVKMVVLRDGKEVELDVTMKASEKNVEN